jgi:photosystem II stability/assembly factor-like uncharacterized protein
MDQTWLSPRLVLNAALVVAAIVILVWLFRGRKYDVFVSYRREGGSFVARALESALTGAGLRVFLDVSSLEGGPFPAQLSKRVATIPNFLLVLSPNSLDRCGNTGDWLCAEITEAFARQRRILPVELPDFKFPANLPAPIPTLESLQRFKYDHVLFGATINRILFALTGYIWRTRMLRFLEYVSGAIAIVALGLAAIFANGELHNLLAAPREAWTPVTIRDAQDKQIPGTWMDIYWVTTPTGRHKAWLAGVAAGPGGWPGVAPSLGRGVLLYTDNVRDSWTDVTNSVNVELRSPASRALPQPARIGPITALESVPTDFFAEASAESRQTFVMATYNGIYRMVYKEGSFLADRQQWTRFDPLPDDRVFFDGLGFMSHSAYAVGWPGILYWRSREGNWRQELNTGNAYPISSVTTLGTSDTPEAWAAGRAGEDSQGGLASTSHGAIYHLRDITRGAWEAIRSPAGIFGPRQALHSVVALDANTIIAVGERGLIVRVTRDNQSSKDWKWERIILSPPVLGDLNSVHYVRGLDTAWIIGNEGAILKATDKGHCWKRINSNQANLHRVRFFGNDSGWIVGDNVVLQYQSRAALLPFLARIPIPHPKNCEN